MNNTPETTPLPRTLELEDLGISKDHYNAVTHPQREGSKPATVASMKIDRIVIKNERRARQGLPPITDYRKI